MRGPDTFMTLRVSRDGGKTYGPVRVHDAEKDNLLPSVPRRWPVCACGPCTARPGPAMKRGALARIAVDVAMDIAGVPAKLYEGGS
ncbi:hypothetical protein EF902_29630 [Streptomyces sp. WAC05858]|nr:hypothetical protein EF902_29630 [Streptomyces sp. WAC05858]